MTQFKSDALKFSSFDGITLEGIFTCPKTQPVGAFLILNGFPQDIDGYGFYSGQPNKIMIYGGMAEFLAMNGYASLRFNYREKFDCLSISGFIADAESAYHVLLERVGKSLPIYVVASSFGACVSIQWINNFERDGSHLFLVCPLLDMKEGLRSIGIPSEPFFDELRKNGSFSVFGTKINHAFINDAFTINTLREFSLLQCTATVFIGSKDPCIKIASNSTSQIHIYDDAGHNFGDTDNVRFNNWQDILNKILSHIISFLK
jgi:hypothetical protein